MPAPDQMKAFIDAVAERSSGAVRLGCLAALAARLEPELLRALRLEITRDLDSGAEADLWFSPLVAARSSSWLVLVPEIAEALRERARTELTESQLISARGLIIAAHEKASPLVQLEDELHWLSLGPDTPAIEAKLQSIISALRSPDAVSVARWAARTMPRLSSHVRELPAAWIVRLMSEQQLGQPLRIDPNGGPVPAEVLPFLRGSMPMTELWVRLVPGGLELARAPLLGGHRFPAPLTEPMTVEVLGEPARTVRVPADAVAFEELPSVETGARLRTLDGTIHEVHTTESTPRASVTFRWLMVTHLVKPDARLSMLASAKFDAVFLVGPLTEKATAYEFAMLQDQLQEIRRSPDPNRATPIFAVGQTHETHSLAFARFVDALPKPSRYRRGGARGDFAATIEHEGTLIGIVGLSATDSRERYLAEVCGMDPQAWAAAHHVTFLVTPGKTTAKFGGFDLYPSGAPWVTGELQIDKEITSNIRWADHTETTEKLPLRRPTLPRRMNRPEKWVLVAGGSVEPENVRNTARELGAALAAAGYGLATGGWPGVDEVVTRAYASAMVGSPEMLLASIHHFVGEIEPGATVPGRRTFLTSDSEAVTKSVEAAAAVVLIGGGSGTEHMGREARYQNKPLLPIAATGGAAHKMAIYTSGQWRASLEQKDLTPREQAETVIRAIADLTAVGKPEPTQQPPANAEKKAQAQPKRPTMKRPMKKARTFSSSKKLKKK